MALIDPELYKILVCPNCHAQLVEDETAAKLRCGGCGLAFAVIDGLPDMLIEDAEKPAGFQAATPASGN